MLTSRLFLLFAAFALAFVVTAGTVSAPAQADEFVKGYLAGYSSDPDDDDDPDIVVYKTPDGRFYAVFFDTETGEPVGWVDLPGGNPDPDGSPTGLAPDFQKFIDALLKAGGTMYGSENFYTTFLGRMLTEKGLTIVPVHNPADVGYEDDGYGGGGGGIDPSSGGIKEHVQNLQRKGRGKSDDDDDDNGGKRPSSEDVWGYDMPGPPEIVNPVPISRSTASLRQQPAGAAGSGQAPATSSANTVVGTLR